MKTTEPEGGKITRTGNRWAATDYRKTRVFDTREQAEAWLAGCVATWGAKPAPERVDVSKTEPFTGLPFGF